MKKIETREITENVVKLIGDKWMLITAGDKTRYNTITASWGGLGYLWNKPVAFVFIRPERYTFEFSENNDFATLPFFGDEYKDALKICGTVSGKNNNKVNEAGLSPTETLLGNITFKEANLVLECKKVYSDHLDPEKFHEKSPLEKWYTEGGMHKMYIYEIINVWMDMK